MKQTLTQSDFIDAFRRMNRYEQFGYEALKVLFEYFEDVNPDMELDVIAICCEFSHDEILDIANNYNIDLSDCAEAEDRVDTVRDWLNDHTTIIGETDIGFVYCSSF